MEHEDRIRRIQAMETRFDLVQERIQFLSGALEAFEQSLPELIELASYYDSGRWRQDRQSDEEGALPDKLKRGVLSEDGIFDLLTDAAGLRERLEEISARLLEL